MLWQRSNSLTVFSPRSGIDGSVRGALLAGRRSVEKKIVTLGLHRGVLLAVSMRQDGYFELTINGGILATIGNPLYYSRMLLLPHVSKQIKNGAITRCCSQVIMTSVALSAPPGARRSPHPLTARPNRKPIFKRCEQRCPLDRFGRVAVKPAGKRLLFGV